jgi:hypothetical protein
MRAAPIVAAVLFAASATAAEFATPLGPEPANLDAVMSQLRAVPHQLELLLSYGTSKGASAGHIALAIAGEAPDDDIVYSANFYADRAPEHAQDFLTEDLMLRIPKKEYLYRTSSSLGPKASFGLDFGEVYKRSVIGVRVHGMPPAERDAIAAYLRRINEDFHARARRTEYEAGEVVYGYMQLNCAKTIGSAFRYGAGYRDVAINTAPKLRFRKIARALNANVPTAMAMQLLEEFDRRGYRMDAVLYRKYPASPYVDPHDRKAVAFADLPNRFPSTISFDFLNEEGEYTDADNLYAMRLLDSLARSELVIDETTKQLLIQPRGKAMSYADAARAAALATDSNPNRRRKP